MADLLTAAERAEIIAATKDVVDTFFKTSCTIQHYISNFGKFTGGAKNTFTDYELFCLYEDSSGMTEKDLEGAKSNYSLKLSFYMNDMPTEVLTAGNLTIFKDNTDYVIVKGNRYKIEKIIYDAPLTEQDLLMIVYCEILQNKV